MVIFVVLVVQQIQHPATPGFQYKMGQIQSIKLDSPPRQNQKYFSIISYMDNLNSSLPYEYSIRDIQCQMRG